jgi:hypothetical protein
MMGVLNSDIKLSRNDGDGIQRDLELRRVAARSEDSLGRH